MEDGILILWEQCESKGCPNMVCSWASLTRCFPCEESIVGTDEMHNRYGKTHEHPWHSTVSPNLMTRTYSGMLRDGE